MNGVLLAAVVSLGLALLVGWAIPAWVMKRLLPVLERSGRLVSNYRGLRIPAGLGIAWLVWAVGVGSLSAAVGLLSAALWRIDPPAWLVYAPVHAVGALPVLLVIGAFAFGTIDDLLDGGQVKGFRGHVSELLAGRLTAGGHKLLGIGTLAVMASAGATAVTGPLHENMAFGLTAGIVVRALVGWGCAGMVIALSANLSNLLDLRPGRAIKVHAVLAVAASLISAVLLWQSARTRVTLDLPGAAGTVWIVAWWLCLTLFVLGPILAVWRHDLGERAMLGDAGANAMGALVGYLLVWRSPLWVDAIVAVVLISLNLASERVSFSRVIDRVRLLRWIDGLGRIMVEPQGRVVGLGVDDGERAGGSAAADDEARKDGEISTR